MSKEQILNESKEKPYTFNKQVINKAEEFAKTFVYANGKLILPTQLNGEERWVLHSGIYTVIDVSSPTMMVRRALLYGDKLMGQYPKYELFIYCLKVDSKQRHVTYKVLGTYYVNEINEISKFAQCDTDIIQ